MVKKILVSNTQGIEEKQDGQRLTPLLDDGPYQGYAIRVVDNSYKRNKVKSLVTNIKEKADTLKEAMPEQVLPSIIGEDFQEVMDKISIYAKGDIILPSIGRILI